MELTLTKRPADETDYDIPAASYYREIRRCTECDVYFNSHDLLSAQLYTGSYNDAIGSGSLRSRFERIRALSSNESDNWHRIQRVVDFDERHGRRLRTGELLDIGSGTCVFGVGMAERGISVSCADPDPKAVAHARVQGIPVVIHAGVGDIETDLSFDCVTLNKVVEHLHDPAAAVGHALSLLRPDGFLYLELPDAQSLVVQGADLANRAEFFVEHYTIHTPASVERLAGMCGARIIESDQIIEPSGKRTLFAFLTREQMGIAPDRSLT